MIFIIFMKCLVLNQYNVIIGNILIIWKCNFIFFHEITFQIFISRHSLDVNICLLFTIQVHGTHSSLLFPCKNITTSLNNLISKVYNTAQKHLNNSLNGTWKLQQCHIVYCEKFKTICFQILFQTNDAYRL